MIYFEQICMDSNTFYDFSCNPAALQTSFIFSLQSNQYVKFSCLYYIHSGCLND